MSGDGEARRFPTAFTVLLAVLVAVWALTFVVPPGAYRYVRCDGGSPRPIPGSYQRSDEAPPAFGERLKDLWLSPVTGLYGVRELPAPVESPEASLVVAAAATCGEGASFEVVGPAGNTGAYNAGSLSGAAQVFFFVLAIGGFIGITLRTGALEAGIAAMTHRFRVRGPLLLALLTAAFAVGGSTYGMAEETLGFYALLVPVLLGLGYDRMVAVGVILVGSGIGTLASTVNPFATGVASGIAGVPLGEGLGLRLVMWVVLTTTAILYIQRYAARVREAPGLSPAPPPPRRPGSRRVQAVRPPRTPPRSSPHVSGGSSGSSGSPSP